MEFHQPVTPKKYHQTQQLPSENIVAIDQHYFQQLTEKITHDKNCRYRLLALQILIHVITGIDEKGRIDISARHLAKKLDVNYDTVTKCLKYLRSIEALSIEHHG